MPPALAHLELRIEEGIMRFKARAKAKAEGLSDGFYYLCVGEGFTGEDQAQGGRVDLGFKVGFETLSGQGCVGPSVLEGTVP